MSGQTFSQHPVLKHVTCRDVNFRPVMTKKGEDLMIIFLKKLSTPKAVNKTDKITLVCDYYELNFVWVQFLRRLYILKNSVFNIRSEATS